MCVCMARFLTACLEEVMLLEFVKMQRNAPCVHFPAFFAQNYERIDVPQQGLSELICSLE